MKTTLIQEIWTRMDAYLTEEQMQTDQAGTSFHIPSWSGMINRLSPLLFLLSCQEASHTVPSAFCAAE